MSKPSKKQKNTNFTTAAKPNPSQTPAAQPTVAAKPAALSAVPIPPPIAAAQPAPKPESARSLAGVASTGGTLNAGQKSGGHVLLEFVKPGAQHVCVAGSFNGWKPESNPLKPAGNGRWVGDLSMKPGRHEYLFVVDGQWLPDPNARETVQNPFGGTNSVLFVSE